MRLGWPVCALLLALGPCLGCGAKSALSETAFDPIGPGQALVSEAGAPAPQRPPPTGPIAVGVVTRDGTSVDGCDARFVDALGDDALVEQIDWAADYSFFHAHDLIVVCSSWAQNDSAMILGRPELYTRYVREGGGLLMFQANPFPLDSLRIDLLPEWFEVATFYDDHDRVSIVDPTHPITQGLVAGDMPFPVDRITGFSGAWIELSRGTVSGDASLIVVDIDRGRAAMNGGHHTKGIVLDDDNNSNALIRRLSLWLTHRL